MNGTHQRLVCVDDVNINTIEKNTHAGVVAGSQTGLEVSTEENKGVRIS